MLFSLAVRFILSKIAAAAIDPIKRSRLRIKLILLRDSINALYGADK